MLKNILFGSLVMIGMIGLSGCASDNDAASKCNTGKSDTTKTVTTKCDSAKKTEAAKCNKGD